MDSSALHTPPAARRERTELEPELRAVVPVLAGGLWRLRHVRLAMGTLRHAGTCSARTAPTALRVLRVRVDLVRQAPWFSRDGETLYFYSRLAPSEHTIQPSDRPPTLPESTVVRTRAEVPPLLVVAVKLRDGQPGELTCTAAATDPFFQGGPSYVPPLRPLTHSHQLPCWDDVRPVLEESGVGAGVVLFCL